MLLIVGILLLLRNLILEYEKVGVLFPSDNHLVSYTVTGIVYILLILFIIF
mgnify:CR=1 FL=1